MFLNYVFSMNQFEINLVLDDSFNFSKIEDDVLDPNFKLGN